ncbi:MAG: signal peptidase II [Gemmatimonadota bacterium]
MEGSDVAAEAAGAVSARRILLTPESLVPMIVIGLDQLTKAWVRAALYVNESVRIIGDYLRLTYIHNEGAAFGLSVGQHSSMIFLVLAVAASMLVLYLYLTTAPGERLQRIALGLILGGALGNIVDRIRWNMVVDFIQVGVGGHYWPIFNLADSAVTVGAVLLGYTYLFRPSRSSSLAS